MSHATLSRRQFIQLASGMTFAVVLPQARGEIEWGTHYVPVSRPQPQAADGKIEILEFFSYTCPHCYHLEATIGPWSRRLPQDVAFRRVPVTFNEAAKFMARVFYAADAMSLREKLHLRLFAAIHDEHLPLVREEALLDWMASQGVDRKKFADMMNAFTMQGQVARATQLMTACDIHSVPAVVVGGKYLTSAAQAGSQEVLPRVMDELILLVKSETSTKDVTRGR